MTQSKRRPATKPRASRSGPSGAHRAHRVKISVEGAELAHWRDAAHLADMSLADWIRGACRIRRQLDPAVSRFGTPRSTRTQKAR